MKLPGIKGFNYNRISSFVKVSGYYSNVLVCVDKELFNSLNEDEVVAAITPWERSYVYEETSSKIITFNEHVKFYPDAIGDLMFLVENYPDFICVAELGEDEEDSVEILGNRQDLLPSSFQESLEHD
jgi:hypothetical protein